MTYTELTGGRVLNDLAGGAAEECCVHRLSVVAFSIHRVWLESFVMGGGKELLSKMFPSFISVLLGALSDFLVLPFLRWFVFLGHPPAAEQLRCCLTALFSHR